ncbi:MAG TPA: tetratricopeptide repeat protein [Phycisphaerae bacterium]|nr:tetratricopeptide repeat protein [Phycisphaerae bacterium]
MNAPYYGMQPAGARDRTAIARVSRADAAALEEAVAAVVSREYDTARPRLATLVGRFEAAGEDDRAAEALFWLSFCYEKTAHKNQAAVFYRQVVDKYPRSAASQQARLRLAHLDLKRPGQGTPAPK